MEKVLTICVSPSFSFFGEKVSELLGLPEPRKPRGLELALSICLEDDLLDSPITTVNTLSHAPITVIVAFIGGGGSSTSVLSRLLKKNHKLQSTLIETRLC